jgi:pimeloyl-ACP methyl ester carboxylesterase
VNAVVARRRRGARDQDPPLRMLLLHGLGGNGTVWRSFIQRAPRRLELWDADLPWGGGVTSADWLDDPDVGQWLIQAMTSMTSAAGDPPDVVVAHSFAATALLEVLDAHAELWPRAAVLVSPFYRADRADFDWPSLRNSIDAFPRLLTEGVGLHARRPDSRRPLAPAVQNDMARHILTRIGPYGWARFLDLYLRTPRLRADQLRLPFLVIGGDRDDAAAPSDSWALGRALPDCRVEIFPGCGHFPMSESPDRFAELLGAFLDTTVTLDTAGTRKGPA